MAKRESFDSLLRAVRGSWLRACEAAAAQYQAALAAWMTVSGDGTAVPRRALFRPPQRAASASPAKLEIAWTDLCERRWVRPVSLSLSFDCELRQRWGGSWQLRIVHPDHKPGWRDRPRHRVDIVVDGQEDGGGEVRFDDRPWRRFGARASERP